MHKLSNINKIFIIISLVFISTLVFNFKNKIFTTQITTAQAQTSTSDWPQLQHDASHSGYIADTYGAPFTELWRLTSTSAQPAPPVSTRVQPVIANNIIYLPSNNNKLYALSTTDSHQLWTFPTNGPLVASAAVDTASNTVIFGSTDKNIYGLNAITGALKWIYQTNGMFRSAPVIANSTVYLGSSDGNLYALNCTNGALLWSQNLTDPIWETPAVYNNSVFVGTMAAKAFALNSSTGAIIWQKQLKGQGFRDRWVSAGNGKVIFTPIPINGGNATQDDAAKTVSTVATSDWATQRQTILTHISQSPFYQTVYILDAASGAETVAPILYSAAGSTSEHAQPVILPNGNFNFVYRNTEGRTNPGCGATCNFWSQYIGEYNPTSNDLTRQDSWGSGTSMDSNLKIPFISDESAGFMRTGNIIYAELSRGSVGFNTVTKTTIPFVTYNISSGGVFYSPPIKFYSNIGGDGWVTQYPGEEANSDGNDYKRPSPIANGVFYVLHNSQLVAVKATKQ